MHKDFQITLNVTVNGTYVQQNYALNYNSYSRTSLSVLLSNMTKLLQNAGVLEDGQSLEVKNDKEVSERGTGLRESRTTEQGTQEGSTQTEQNCEEAEPGIS